MTIAIGDKIPAHDFIVMGADGPDKRSSADIFDGKKVVLIGVPLALWYVDANYLPLDVLVQRVLNNIGLG